MITKEKGIRKLYTGQARMFSFGQNLKYLKKNSQYDHFKAPEELLNQPNQNKKYTLIYFPWSLLY